ncbi:hypothetical protein CQZ93_19625 [Ochrobactrum vermis]|nr:hypothetical protein CQZ93_19625 [Ochrobactrum vermis]
MTGSRRDFSKLNRQKQMSKYGHEAVSGGWLAPFTPKRRLSKAELREQLASAMEHDTRINKHLKCACGHGKTINISIAEASGPFRCSGCSRAIL